MLGNRFDHAAEAIMPILLNLVPNSAKVMATSGVAAIHLILRVRAIKQRLRAVSMLITDYDIQGRKKFNFKPIKSSSMHGLT